MCNYINFLQKINNLLYSVFGDKDFVINFQVFINTKRHENDETDISEIIASDENMEYVQ